MLSSTLHRLTGPGRSPTNTGCHRVGGPPAHARTLPPRVLLILNFPRPGRERGNERAPLRAVLVCSSQDHSQGGSSVVVPVGRSVTRYRQRGHYARSGRDMRQPLGSGHRLCRGAFLSEPLRSLRLGLPCSTAGLTAGATSHRTAAPIGEPAPSNGRCTGSEPVGLVLDVGRPPRHRATPSRAMAAYLSGGKLASCVILRRNAR